ncbi:ArsR/SmtB family transcription factor [Paramicrobacterium sp. CJ85]|uniref:ArsR/SmtB family transcription factor n=1 Tax=Paramicrobacterium sp. CJ85 TaxID=3445355 RepID=UPI003F60F496
MQRDESIDKQLSDALGIPDRPIHLRDAEAMRVMSHPARQRVVNLMFADQQPHTSTELSELTGLTPSAMSYHLRALEKVGLVERVDAEGDSRTRPWRAAGTSIALHGSDSEGVWETLDAFMSLALSDLRKRAAAHSTAYPDGGSPYVGLGESTLWLTDDEASHFAQALQRAELELVKTGWRNEPAPGRRLSHAIFSLLPEIPLEDSDTKG